MCVHAFKQNINNRKWYCRVICRRRKQVSSGRVRYDQLVPKVGNHSIDDYVAYSPAKSWLIQSLTFPDSSASASIRGKHHRLSRPASSSFSPTPTIPRPSTSTRPATSAGSARPPPRRGASRCPERSGGSTSKRVSLS